MTRIFAPDRDNTAINRFASDLIRKSCPVIQLFYRKGIPKGFNSTYKEPSSNFVPDEFWSYRIQGLFRFGVNEQELKKYGVEERRDAEVVVLISMLDELSRVDEKVTTPDVGFFVEVEGDLYMVVDVAETNYFGHTFRPNSLSLALVKHRQIVTEKFASDNFLAPPIDSIYGK